MSTILNLVQGTADWLAHRQSSRNASEASVVMGCSPWLTRYQLWAIKTSRLTQGNSYAMRHGQALEPEARAAYEAATGRVMEPVVMVEGAYSASLDGLDWSGEVLLEIKCPLKGQDSETWRRVVEGEIPEHYRWQLQHQLMVSGAQKAHFYVYVGQGVGRYLEVQPDPEAQARLRDAWNVFMNYVETDTPPPLTDRDSRVRDDDLWRQAAETYRQRKREAEAVALALDAAKARLIALTSHPSERGHGVAVSRVLKPGASQPEYRVTVLKGEAEAIC